MRLGDSIKVKTAFSFYRFIRVLRSSFSLMFSHQTSYIRYIFLRFDRSQSSCWRFYSWKTKNYRRKMCVRDDKFERGKININTADVVDSHIDTDIDVDKTCFLRCYCVSIMNVHFTSSHVQLSLFIFRGFVVLLSILAINLSLSLPPSSSLF